MAAGTLGSGTRTFGRKGRPYGPAGGRTGSAGQPGRRLRKDESGQALVEFALISPLFLLLVVGIIQFGVALNYWMDLQRIANQGARWAVVNAYPGCPNTGPETPCNPTLEGYLESEPLSGGHQPDAELCFEAMSGPSGAVAIGDAVTVRLTSEFSLVPIVGLGSIDLHGVATMRVEESPTRYGAGLC
jgi:Flp pilus assembly pilin Flp